MVRSGGNIKIFKHNHGRKLPGLLAGLKKRGYITEDKNGKFHYMSNTQLEFKFAIKLSNIF